LKNAISTNNFIKDNDLLVRSCFTQRPHLVLSRLEIYVRFFVGYSYHVVNSSYFIYCFLRLLMYKPSLVQAQLKLRDGGLSGKYQWIRLYEIKVFLHQYKPSSIIEFGSGASTLLFNSYALESNSKFVGLEENEIWRTEVLNASKKIGSKCFESCKTSLIYVPRIETLDSELGILTCHYEFDVGDNYYEMAYVDGPTNWIQNSKESVSDNFDPYGLLPNSDIVLMKKEPKFVIIDGRRSTIKYCLLFDRFKKYSINLSNKYQTMNNNYQEKSCYHTMLFQS